MEVCAQTALEKNITKNKNKMILTEENLFILKVKGRTKFKKPWTAWRKMYFGNGSSFVF